MKDHKIKAWVEETAMVLVKENFKIIADCPKPYGLSSTDPLVYTFIQKTIEMLLVQAFSSSNAKNLEGEEAYEHTKATVGNVKYNLQNAISQGFETTFRNYSGADVDYMCTIKPIDKPVNSKPC